MSEATITDAATAETQRRFRRARAGLFGAGFATFGVLYCTQPLLPVLRAEFGVSPASSALPLSLATEALAFAILVAGPVSETLGRKSVMLAATITASLLTLLVALLPGWGVLLALRAASGAVLSGVPPVIMAYIAEEFAAAAPRAMGTMIAGNAIGGMSGRIMTGALADIAPWRLAIASVAVLAGIAAFTIARLPASTRFQRRPPNLHAVGRAYLQHLRDPALRLLFALGFLGAGGFVVCYNYLTFRLVAPPFGLSQAMMAGVFLMYLLGSLTASWVGVLTARHGSARLIIVAAGMMLAGLAVMLADPLPLVVAGLALFTCGFFTLHTIASGAVGRRAAQARAQASALYLFCFYNGFSIIGYAGGLAWSRGAWPGVSLLIGLLALLAGVLGVRLRRLVGR